MWRLIIEFRPEGLWLEIPKQNFNTGTAEPHLFFLQDDFLLQHFDSIELVIGFELGEQDLHMSLLVSGLFSKQSSPPSRHSAVRTLHQTPLKTAHAAQICDWWKQMTMRNLTSVLILCNVKKRSDIALQSIKIGLKMWLITEKSYHIKGLVDSSCETLLWCHFLFSCFPVPLTRWCSSNFKRPQ